MSFDADFADVQGMFDEIFGRSYRILPMAKADVNGRPGPDPTRAEIDIVAVPSEIHSRAGAENGPSQFDVARAGHSSARLQFNVLASTIPFRPRVGDRIVDAAGALFVISEVRPEGDGRLALDANALARP